MNLSEFNKSRFLKCLAALLFAAGLFPATTFAGTEVDGQKLTSKIITITKATTRSLGLKILPFPGRAYKNDPYFSETHPGLLQKIFMEGVAWNNLEETNRVVNCEFPTGSKQVMIEDASELSVVNFYNPRPRIILCGGLITSLKSQERDGFTDSEMRGFVAHEIVKEVFLYVQGQQSERVSDELVTSVVCGSKHSDLYMDYCEKQLGSTMRVKLDH